MYIAQSIGKKQFITECQCDQKGKLKELQSLEQIKTSAPIEA